jgi:ADP-L-glycero-D-manno-heptose 6-epimerase
MEATGAACGVEAKIDYVDTPLEIRANYQYLTEAKLSRLQAAGYNAAFTPLEQAIDDFVNNYLRNPDTYL